MDLITHLLEKGWSIKISTKKNKKYDVFDDNNNFIVSFGDIRFNHYHDLLGYYKKLNHNDEKRLNAFRNRFKNLYNKNKNNPSSALLWSWNLLW
jgi:hypothetical protein